MSIRTHRPTTCPKCGKADVPVYELGLPTTYDLGRNMGALHLADHGCTKGGDHMLLQSQVLRDMEGGE